MTTAEKLAAVRQRMQECTLDMMIVLTADPHHSEYLPDYYKTRAWLSGFTGSAGTLVITRDEAALFTDGRYFIQAERQLAGSGITLMRMRAPGVPTLEEYVRSNCHENMRIGTDFALLSEKQARLWADWTEAGAQLVDSGDLVGALWTDRPPLPDHPVVRMTDEIAGETTQAKIDRIRGEMNKAGARVHILSVLDEIAWTLNVRGEDVANTPVVISYLAILPETALWFVDERKVPAAVRESLSREGVEVRPYSSVFETVRNLAGTFLLDPETTTAQMYRAVENAGVTEGKDPVIGMKCIKNAREIEGLRHCHEQDGAAVTRFMYWLKTRADIDQLTEMEASEKLAEFREMQPGYTMPSFDTICAYGPNAAMMHYKATEESNAPLKRFGFLLIDSGGQYEDGTTDITRTFVLGELSDRQRLHFTAVLRSVIRLCSAVFLQGMQGKSLDILARGPVWDLGIDYRCGTGHGVGFRLNVHEGPNSFRWHESPGRGEEAVIEPGMVTTDEPGIYLEGEYGIRTENELLCRVRETNEYGTFLEFETITYVPVDLDAVNPEQMSTDERRWLNAYHAEICRRILPYMQTEDERAWLENATRAI